ncbi:hypothetical protein DL546_007582 [Coniochaeta pulveracea]|uniref:Uncharacterized protein n=1 Tax=Coniochaeta pulveracea TaxID=177199 RepID=A0A420YDZ0_9PEZI|nr:hypothetical protein DL546_007582 [Coniochaeta pulveracea]
MYGDARHFTRQSHQSECYRRSNMADTAPERRSRESSMEGEPRSTAVQVIRCKTVEEKTRLNEAMMSQELNGGRETDRSWALAAPCSMYGKCTVVVGSAGVEIRDEIRLIDSPVPPECVPIRRDNGGQGFRHQNLDAHKTGRSSVDYEGHTV